MNIFDDYYNTLVKKDVKKEVRIKSDSNFLI